jgi:hypothetical protein
MTPDIGVYRSQMIECVINPSQSNLTTLPFPDQPYLRTVETYGIEVYNVDDIPTSPEGNAVVSGAVMSGATLNFYCNDPDNQMAFGLFQQNVPFTRMHNTTNASFDPFNRVPYKMRGQKIYWEKCQIVLPNGNPLGNTANVSFLLMVYFRQPVGQEQ